MKAARAAAAGVLCTWGTAMPLAAAAAQELVLPEGVRLSATTASGTVGVLAGEGLQRTYEWNGCSYPAAMMARSSRWYGALGIYDPAGRGPGGMLFGQLFGCKGVSRTVVQEAQAHFATQAAAERWIARQATLPFETVWSGDGLVVQWGVSPARQQINVDVWQVCVAGAPPRGLAGARDEAIRLQRTAGQGALRHACAAVGPDALLGAR